jgi:hypothetical protein
MSLLLLLSFSSFLRHLILSFLMSPSGSLHGSGSGGDIFSRKLGQVDRHGDEW